MAGTHRITDGGDPPDTATDTIMDTIMVTTADTGVDTVQDTMPDRGFPHRVLHPTAQTGRWLPIMCTGTGHRVSGKQEAAPMIPEQATESPLQTGQHALPPNLQTEPITYIPIAMEMYTSEMEMTGAE